MEENTPIQEAILILESGTPKQQVEVMTQIRRQTDGSLDWLEAGQAVRKGKTVAVDYDGPKADAIRPLLNQLPFPKGGYAIGKDATRLLLMESENPVRIASRGDVFQRLGLNPDDLVVQGAIEITRDYLALFV